MRGGGLGVVDKSCDIGFLENLCLQRVTKLSGTLEGRVNLLTGFRCPTEDSGSRDVGEVRGGWGGRRSRRNRSRCTGGTVRSLCDPTRTDPGKRSTGGKPLKRRSLEEPVGVVKEIQKPFNSGRVALYETER